MGGLFRLQAYGEVPSTNEIVKRAIEEGEPEGLAVGARVQTAGYGRQGRAWSSPDGGMYLFPSVAPPMRFVSASHAQPGRGRCGEEGDCVGVPGRRG